MAIAQSDLSTTYSITGLGFKTNSDAPVSCFTEAPPLCATVTPPETIITLGSGINDATTLATILNTTNISNRFFRLAGLFLVDKDISFTNCDFQAVNGSFSKILVISGQNPVSFSASDCNFYACNALWAGIEVLGKNGISLENCKIEDAWYAIHFDSERDLGPVVACSPSVRLTSTTFNRNKVGIYCDGSDDQTIAPTLLLSNVSNCLFTSTSFLLEDDGGNTGGPNYSPGMFLSGVTMSLGLSSSTGLCSEFYCLSNGIAAASSIITVNGRCKFGNSVVGKTTGSSFPDTGHGILAINGSAVRIGFGQPSEFFDNENAGILSDDSALRVNRCDFRGNLFGIGALASVNPRIIYITDNTIDMDSYGRVGIIADRSPNGPATTPRLIIRGNKITRSASNLFAGDPFADPQWLAAIRVQLTASAANDNCFVLDNTYSDKTDENIGWTSDRGIDVSTGLSLPGSGNRVQMSRNIINYESETPQPVTKQGFFMLMPLSTGMKVIDNQVLGKKIQTAHENYGFVVRSSPNTLYCSNKVEQVGIGMRFASDNSPSWLKTTDFGPCSSIGLGLFSTGLDDQNLYKNQWALGQTAYGFRAAFADQLSAFNSKFLVDFSIPEEYPAGDISPAAGWFFSDMGNNSGCFEGDGGEGDPLRITRADRSLFDGSLAQATDFAPYSLWERKVHTLYKLKTVAELTIQDAAAGAYYTNQAHSPEGQVAELYGQLEQAYHSALAAQLSTEVGLSERLEEDFFALTEQISSIDDIIAIPTDVRDTWEKTASDIQIHNTLLRQMEQATYNERLVAIQQVREYNAQIAATTPVALTEQMFIDVALKGLINGGFDQDDLDALRTIAAQDEDTGGNAALRARMMIQALPTEAQRITNRSNNPYQMGSRTVVGQCQVYPNPARTQIEVRSDQPLVGDWAIINLSGITVLTGTTNEQKSLSIHLAGMTQGHYLFTAIQTDGTPVLRLFSVSK
jgi:hypothetical protein